MSTNPMQRISDLEAKVAALTAENQSLRSNGNGNGHLDLEKLIEKLVGREFDRFGRLFREEFTGKVAGMITPYIESTVRRCADVEKKQATLEHRFKAHEEALGKSADAMAASFKKLRAEAEKDWKAHRAQMQEDFVRVDGFVNWFETAMAKNAQENLTATMNCNLAVRACHDLLKKLDRPVEELITHLNRIKAHGDTILNEAAQNLSNTYKRLRWPVLARVTILMIVTVFVHLGVGAFTLWGNRAAINTNWQELTEYSEQQKTELKGLINKTFEEVKATQIAGEIKVKMWDSLIQTLPPGQRQQVFQRFREQVNAAEEKRLREQMGSSNN